MLDSLLVCGDFEKDSTLYFSAEGKSILEYETNEPVFRVIGAEELLAKLLVDLFVSEQVSNYDEILVEGE